MRLLRLVLIPLIIATFFVVDTQEVYSQNPKRTKKYKKKNKKRQKASDEPIEYTPRRKQDSDNDGVPNYYDHCPNTPAGQTVTPFGCPPDKDGDGIADTEDECVDTPGPKSNNGCPPPDRDGDGILDRLDMCPDTPGEARWNGCADRDKDGVQDSKDKCPDTPGLIGLQGCPKQDEDTDKDGILDKDDKCILVPGPESNQGCPELKPEEKEALKAAFDNLLFETGKAVIKESSYSSLRDLAEVMNNNNHILLDLEGHTDNVGDDNANMKLSWNRAEAVKQFLVDEGVAANRVTAEGFGETRPVESNDTDYGRQLNRRVEMDLHY